MKFSTAARYAAASALGCLGLIGSVHGVGAQGVDVQSDRQSNCQTVPFANGQRLKATITHTPHIAVSLAAGTYSLSGVAQDIHPGRVTSPQLSERFEVLFLDRWGNILGTSAMSADLDDSTDSATWSGSLGSVTLPAGVTQVRGHHRGDAPADGTANSLNPLSFTACAPIDTEPTTSTTEATTTTVAETTTTVDEVTTTTLGETTTTVADVTTTTVGAAVSPATTIRSAPSTQSSSVLGSSQTAAPAPTELAATGRNGNVGGLGLMLLGAGLIALATSTRLTMRGTR